MIGVVAACVFACALAQAAPPAPVLLRATPETGSSGVDPGVGELRLVFDRPMRSDGYSICGSGPEFPELDGRPRWETPEVLVIPVRLAPDATYSFSVNCDSARNTVSAEGTPSHPAPIRFTTGPAGVAGQPEPDVSSEVIDRVIGATERAIATRYAYADRTGTDWGAAFTLARASASKGVTGPGLGRVLARTLAEAQDPHVGLSAGGAAVPLGLDRPISNFRFEQVRWLAPDLAAVGPAVHAATLQGGVGYVLIQSWDEGAAQDASAALDRFRDQPAIIIDVRPNGGGDELAARLFAARFLDEPRVYSRHEYRDTESPSGFGPMIDRIVLPSPEPDRYRGRVALLIGPASLSSNESFILMLKGTPRVRTFGLTTGGSSGNPRTHDLGDGFTLRLPAWRDYLPDGTLLEGRGIEPDQRVDDVPQHRRDDPTLRAALTWALSPPAPAAPAR